MILQLFIPFTSFVCTQLSLDPKSYDQDLAPTKILWHPLWYASCLGSLDYEHILTLIKFYHYHTHHKICKITFN